MAREDDFEDDDRPRRPRRRDDDDRPRRRDDDDDRDLPPRQPKKSNAAMIVGIICTTILLLCGGLAGGLWYGCKKVVEKGENILKDAQKDVMSNMKDKGESNETTDRLKELGKKLKNYHDLNQSFPGDSYDAAGKPLLSWRVHLLPLLNRNDLYRKFKLDEPWDSPANKALLREMPGEYATAASRTKADNEKTYFRGFGSPGGMFERIPGPQNANPPKGTTMNGVIDGTSSTILLFEAGDPIEWTKPDQLSFRDGQAPPKVGGISPQNPFFHVLMVDGIVKKARRTIDPITFRNLVNRQDGMVIAEGWESP